MTTGTASPLLAEAPNVNDAPQKGKSSLRGSHCWASSCGRVTLYLADCMALLPIKADALVSDPPYGINYKPKRFRKSTQPGRNRDNWNSVGWETTMIGDEQPFSPKPWLAYPKIVLWGANHYADQLPVSGGWLFWDKLRAEGFAGSDGELAWTNCLKTARRFRYLWDGFRRGGEHGQYHHPTQKPIALMEWCMDQAKISEGDTVIDPYMGSGTTGIACIRTGRNFIGIEKDPAHYATALQRIKSEMANGDLFCLPNSALNKTHSE